MKMKTLITGALTAAMLSSACVSPVLALPNTAVVAKAEDVKYASFAGTIISITASGDDKLVTVEDNDDNKMTFLVTSGALAIEDYELKENDEFIVFYDENDDAEEVEAIAYAGTADNKVDFDFYNEDLINTKKTIKLRISDDTEVVDSAGEGLENKVLIVIYKNLIIGAQDVAVPEKVTVYTTKTAGGEATEELPSAYASFSGTVKEILPFEVSGAKAVMSVFADDDNADEVAEEGTEVVDNDNVEEATEAAEAEVGPEVIATNPSKYFVVVSAGETEAKFFVDENTVVYGTGLEVGAKIIGFYDAEAPLTLIYPPQYNVVAIGVNVPEGKTIKVDKFDENLVSADKKLTLTIAEGLKITAGAKKEAYSGSLAGQDLVVIYGTETKTIDEVIVLPAKNALDLAGIIALMSETPGTPVVIGGTVVANHKALVKNGVLMVAVRPISEALGLTVDWNGETETVMVGNTASFSIGVNGFTVNGETTELAAAPALIEDLTFVPFDFFHKLMERVVEYSDGNVVIK